MKKNQELGIKNYALKDLINFNFLKKLTQHFYDVTGFAVGLIDVSGQILISVGWQEICTEFHRKNDQTLANCRESDRHIESELGKGNYAAYKCKNGLVDVAVPIIINGVHLASLFFGQFFWENDKPDAEVFRKQAQKFGFDEESYLNAYGKIKTYNPEQVDKLMKFYSSLVDLIGDMAIQKLKIKQESEEKERIRKQISESEQKYRSLIETSADPVFTIRENGEFVFINQTAAKQLGGKPEHIIGKKMQDIFPPEIAERQLKTIKKVFATRKSYSGESRTVVNNQPRWYSMSIYPVINDEGTVEYAQSVARDITDIKNSQKQIEEQQQFLESIYMGTEAALFILEVTENGEFRFLGLNPAHEKVSGMLSKDVKGKTIDELYPMIPGDVLPVIKSNYQRCLNSGSTIRYEEMIPMMGKDIWWLTTLTPIRNPEGRITNIIGSAMPINELKETQIELEKHRNHLSELVEEKTTELNKQNERLQVEIEERSTIEEELRAANEQLESEIREKTAIEEELRDTNEKLQKEIEERTAIEEELRSTNDQLTGEIEERQKIQQQNEKLIFDLGERVKEMNCVNRINMLIDSDVRGMDEVLNLVTDLIPPALQYPDDTYCRITTSDNTYESSNFSAGGNMISETLYCSEKATGKIEVFHQPSHSQNSNFLNEEVKLLENIASILSNAITREYVIDQLKIKNNAIHNSINGFALAELSGTIMDVNPQFTELWGYEKKEAIGMHFSQLLDEREPIRENMAELQTKGHWRGDIKGKRKNGALFDVQLSASVVLNDKGEPIALSSSFIDISESKRTQIELENALVFNKTVVMESPLGKLAYDKSGECILANPKAAELTGASIQDLLAQNFNRLDSWKKSGLKKTANEVLNTGKNQTIEIKVTNTFGKKVWLECHFTRFYQLEEPHLMVVFSDVSINRMAQLALKESEQRLTLSTEAANAGIWDWKIKTNEVYFSRQWKQQLGYSEEELKNEFSTWENLLHPEEHDRMLQKVYDFLDNPEGTFIAEFRMKHKDGSYRWIHNHASGIKDETGNLIRMFGAHTDVTEKVETLQKLEKNEKRFRTLVQATAQLVWQTKPDGTVDEYQETWGTYTGQTFEQMKGTGWLQAIHPDDREKTSVAWFRAVGKKTPYDSEHRLRRHDGVYRHFSVRGVPLLDDRKNITEWIGTHTDITERKKFEQALKSSEEQYRRIFESVTDAIFICDNEGKIVDTNPAATRMYGYSQKEFTGRSPVEFVHPDYHHEFGRLLTTVLKGETFLGETIDITKEGKHINSQVIGTTLMFNGRQHIMGIVRNITEVKKAREEIDRFFNVTLELLAIAGTDGYFKKLNPSWNKLLGHTEEELLNSPFIEFVHPEDVNKTLEETKKLGSGHETLNFVNRYRCKDGTYRWLQWNTIPVDETLYAAANDITELKETEDELKKLLQELERSNKELEQFAYIASHDLQEPLRMVTGFLQLLEKRYGSQLGEDAKEFIGFAVDGADRMKVLINDLLKYSRVGTRAKPFEPTDLADVLKIVEQNLRTSIDESGAVVKTTGLPDLDADRSQMVQLFQNLIGNAIKFRSDKNPEITITSKDETDFWLLSVSDNGIGIEQEHWERIFTIFQRLHSKDKYSGTGIGLAICKKIVERHNGKIWINSVPGEGTTFNILLPKKQEE